MIKYIHSAAVCVRDQDAAVDFYVNKLGFEKRRDDPFGEESRWIEIGPPGAETVLALLRPQDMGRSPEEGIGAFTGISLIAEDINATYEQLSARGVQFTQPPQAMPWGAMATWFSDPDGNSYFLSEG